MLRAAVFAFVALMGSSAVADGVKIHALLPNPRGLDEGNETITLENQDASAVDLAGWKFRDAARNTFPLTGSIAGRAKKVIKLTTFDMPLNNNGDTIELLDSAGKVVHKVTYEAEQVKNGEEIVFEEKEKE